MEPEFKDGHIIIVDPGMPVVHGAYVVIEYDGETTFRQFVIDDQRHFLKALNQDFPVIELQQAYKVHGVVVQRGGRRRKDIKHYQY